MWVYVEGEDDAVVAAVLVLVISEDECDGVLAVVGVVVPTLDGAA